MTRAKPRFVPEPRIWTDEQCAARLNISPDGKKLKELERQHGFPKRNAITGGRLADEVEEWIDFIYGRRKSNDPEEFSL